MIKSRKLQLVVVPLLACICAGLFGAEPKEAQSGLRFEIDKEKVKPWISGRTRRGGRGPIKPTHVAVFYIQRPSSGLPASHEGILQILDTSAGRSLSEKQRQFLTASDALTWWGIEDIQNHDMVYLYAVSEEEAKKTVQAYLEVAINKAKARMEEYEKVLKETKEKISEIQKELPEKQKQFKEADSKYMEIKDARYFSLGGLEVYIKAKELMLEMDKMLDILEIELAGIREKLEAIEKYRSTKLLSDKRLSDNTVDKLDQMFVEQMVELRGIEARKKAALRIRTREKEFLVLFNQQSSLESEVNGLKRSLDNSENRVRSVEERLANPEPNMLPPKVYQDKATIYRVLDQ